MLQPATPLVSSEAGRGAARGEQRGMINPTTSLAVAARAKQTGVLLRSPTRRSPNACFHHLVAVPPLWRDTAKPHQGNSL